MSRVTRRNTSSEARRGSIRVEYSSLTPGGLARPYLTLELVGIDGDPFPVTGLVDTGADYTLLPLGFAADVFGLTEHALAPVPASQATGPVTLRRAEEPVVARLLGLGNEFELEPLFVPGVSGEGDQAPSWGRRDFLRAWDLRLSERAEAFTLSWSR